MVAELVVMLPFMYLKYNNCISLRSFLFILFVFYWLPKFFIIRGLETLYPEVITRNSNKSNIALTFDDVPYDSYKKIINLLNSYEMKGTFLIISSFLTEEDKKVLVQAIKNGHQLANHGKTNSMHYLKSMKQLNHEVSDCQKLIEELYSEAGVELPPVKYYRPGCGLFGRKMLNYLSKNSYKLLLGSVYPNDPMVRSSIINYYYLINHIGAGDIVILHDRKWTPNLLKMLLPYLKERSIESVTVQNLMDSKFNRFIIKI